MRPRVVQRRNTIRRHYRPAREVEYYEWKNQYIEHREFHLSSFNLFAEVLRSTAYHQPCDENRQNDVNQHGVESRAVTAEDQLAQLYIRQRHESAERCETVVHRINGAG